MATAFDPSQPFTVEDDFDPAQSFSVEDGGVDFDPTQPFEVLDDTEENLRDYAKLATRGIANAFQAAGEGVYRGLAENIAPVDRDQQLREEVAQGQAAIADLEKNTRMIPEARQAGISGQQERIDRANAEMISRRTPGTPQNQEFQDYDNSPTVAIADTLRTFADEAASQRQAVREALPVATDVAQSTVGQLVQGAGQLATAPAYLIPGVGPAISVAQLYQEGYDDYVNTKQQRGEEVIPSEANAAATTYAAAAGPIDVLADSLPAGQALKALVGKAPIKQAIAEIGKIVLAGGASEGFQQATLNTIASQLAQYDPDRPLTQDVLNSTLIGAAVSGVGATGAEVAGRVSAPQAVKETKVTVLDAAAANANQNSSPLVAQELSKQANTLQQTPANIVAPEATEAERRARQEEILSELDQPITNSVSNSNSVVDDERFAPPEQEADIPQEVRRNAIREASIAAENLLVNDPDQVGQSSLRDWRATLPPEIASTVQAHGAPIGELQNILDQGIDPDRPFYTAPLNDSGSGALGLRDVGTGGQALILGAPGQQIKDSGVQAVVVNDYLASSIPQLQAAYPNVTWLNTQNATQWLNEQQSTGLAQPTASNQEQAIIPQEAVTPQTQEVSQTTQPTEVTYGNAFTQSTRDNPALSRGEASEQAQARNTSLVQSAISGEGIQGQDTSSPEFRTRFLEAVEAQSNIPAAEIEQFPVEATGTAEHYVRYDPRTDKAIKVLFPNRNGMFVEVTPDDAVIRQGTLPEYLQRIDLFNQVFDGDLTIEGTTRLTDSLDDAATESPSLVVSQTWEVGGTPTQEEVSEYMRSLGFQPGRRGEQWYRPDDGIYVADARTANFVKTPDGVRAIDLLVSQNPTVSFNNNENTESTNSGGVREAIQPTVAESKAVPNEGQNQPAQRVQIGSSPQTHTIVEELPQSAREAELGERYFTIRNERTGEEQVVEQNDMRPVRGKAAEDAAKPEADAAKAKLNALTPTQRDNAFKLNNDSGAILLPDMQDIQEAVASLARKLNDAYSSFSQWADAMVRNLGPNIAKYLRQIYDFINTGGGRFTPEQSRRGALGSADLRKPKRSQVGGVEGIGQVYNPRNLATSEVAVREKIFDGTQEPTDINTDKAWDLIQRMSSGGDESVQASREANEVTGNDIGSEFVQNELLRYATNLAAQGDRNMLQFLLNTVNTMETVGGMSQKGAALRARGNFQHPLWASVLGVSQNSDGQAAKLFRGDSGIKPEDFGDVRELKALLAKLKLMPDEAREALDQLQSMKGRNIGDILSNLFQGQNIDLGNPMLQSILNLARLGYAGEGQFTFNYTPGESVFPDVKNRIEGDIKAGLANYRSTMVEGAGTGLNRTFWQTLSSKPREMGILGEIDAAQNNALAKIVSETLEKMGLKGVPKDNKLTPIQKVAAILNKNELSKEKILDADKKIRADINSKFEAALETATTQEYKESVAAHYTSLLEAWDDSMSRLTDMPVSDSMIRRIVSEEVKELGVNLNDQVTARPAEAVAERKRVLDSIVAKLGAESWEGRNYTDFREWAGRMYDSMIETRRVKYEAARLRRELRNAERNSPDAKAEGILARLAVTQSDTPTFSTPSQQDAVSQLVADDLKTEPTNKEVWQNEFTQKLIALGVNEGVADRLSESVWREHEIRAENKAVRDQQIKEARDAKELDRIAAEPERIAQGLINRFAQSQSDTPTERTKTREAEVRRIIRNDLQNTPNMGRRAAWKSQLEAQLINAGVSTSTAETLATITWREHEIKAANRDMREQELAATQGPVGPIIEAIVNTPLKDQQNPEWIKNTVYNYLKSAGLSNTQADSAATYFQSQLKARMADTQAKVAERFIKSLAPWQAREKKDPVKAKTDLDRIIQAVRTRAADPSMNFTEELAAQNGWKGFSDAQFARMAELDKIISDETRNEHERARAQKELKDIVRKAKIPASIMNALPEYYTAQALSGVPTATVNVFSPAMFLVQDAVTAAINSPLKGTQGFQYFTNQMKNLVGSLSGYLRELQYSLKNDVYSKQVNEFLNTEGQLQSVLDQGLEQFNSKNLATKAKGVSRIVFGSMDYVRRVLSALDQASVTVLENTYLGKYAADSLRERGFSESQISGIAATVAATKQKAYDDAIAAGLPPDEATVASHDQVRTAWVEALNAQGADGQDVSVSALNDALGVVGRKTEDGETDAGFLSYPFMKTFDALSKVGQGSTAGAIFTRMIFGFFTIPARVVNKAAWYSPYGFLRYGYIKAAEKKGLENPYASSAGTDAQLKSRLNEAIAGSIVLAMASTLLGGSDDEDDDGFSIVMTGNGPPSGSYRDAWLKKWKPWTINAKIGETIIPLNIGRGGESFLFSLLPAAAIDDYKLAKKAKLQNPDSPEKQESIFSGAYTVAGSIMSAIAMRGAPAPLVNAGQGFVDKRAGDPLSKAASGIAFAGKTFIPIVGTSLARNFSDLVSGGMVDRSSPGAAITSNIPFVAPLVNKPALNALGDRMQDSGMDQKLFRAGIPAVISLPPNSPKAVLYELIRQKGHGPSVPNRKIVEDKVGRTISDDEWYNYGKTYGDTVSNEMLKYKSDLAKETPAEFKSSMNEFSELGREEAYYKIFDLVIK